ncbi:MAG: hypothetical protein KF718_19340 [Polyangiaceae bacterium]|nr:hypothetical protein [Polyangiaceae bacterium]
MRLILFSIVLTLAGCRAQTADAQGAGPELPARPAPGPGAQEPALQPDEAVDDAGSAASHAAEFAESSLARYRAEPVDSAWATPTQSAIQAAVDKATSGFPATVTAAPVTCRRSTCLLELTHGGESTRDVTREILISKVYGVVRTQQGHECSMAVHAWPNPDGSLVDRVYFTYLR